MGSIVTLSERRALSFVIAVKPPPGMPVAHLSA